MQRLSGFQQAWGAAGALPRHFVLIIGLVVLADLLFWDFDAGISLVLFAFALFLSAAVIAGATRCLAKPAVLLAVASAPVVDYAQVLSVLFLGAGLAMALAWLCCPDLSLRRVPMAGASKALYISRQWGASLMLPRAAKGALQNWRETTSLGALRALLAGWALPIGGTLIFAALLLRANPILADAFRPDWSVDVGRVLFWAGLLWLLWPFLDRAAPASLILPSLPKRAIPGLNRASVERALWIFNALILVQTVLDLTILIGGAALPEGMTYAEYAHRGAYPLLATALLAGTFALAARPFLGQGRWLKPLLLLWLAQNVLLCGTAFLRLDLYVETYGLTYLRIYAMIWIALVAGGLALTAAQVFFAKSNGWLLTGATTLGLATLYTASFINFAGHIARHNLTLPVPDLHYLCQLGPMTGIAWPKPDYTVSVHPMPCYVRPERIDAWPEWGLRKARITRYQSSIPATDRSQ